MGMYGNIDTNKIVRKLLLRRKLIEQLLASNSVNLVDCLVSSIFAALYELRCTNVRLAIFIYFIGQQA